MKYDLWNNDIRPREFHLSGVGLMSKQLPFSLGWAPYFRVCFLYHNTSYGMGSVVELSLN